MKTEAHDRTHSNNVNESPQCRGGFWQDAKTAQVRRKTAKKCLLLLPLLACIFVLSGCEEQASSATAKPVEKAASIEVKAIHPHRGEVYRFINLPGEVRPLYEVTLFAKVNGYLDKLAVDKGDSVKTGDLIADIDVPELRANLVKYKAELELAQAEYGQVSQNSSTNASYVPASDTDTGKSRQAIANGKLAVAKSNLQYTETMLKYTRLTAPFDGVITHRYVDPGAYIPLPDATSTPETAAIVNLTDFKTLRLQVAVPETEATHIKIGQPIRWTADGYPGEHFDGKVTRAYWSLEKATKTMLTETQMTNPGMKLQPGMLVNARISIDKKNDALVLPVEAVVKEKANSFVFIFNDGKAKKTPIEVGFNDGTNVEVIAGITPADLAIVPGQQALRDGQLVKVTEGK